MAARNQVEPELHANQETWELQVQGTVWVWVKDAKALTGWRKQRAGGSGGSKRLHITAEERRYNEEQVVDENSNHNIFRNGAIIRVDKGAPADDIVTRYHLSDQDLRDLIEVRDLALFSEEISTLDNELIIRRLADLSSVHGTQAQTDILRNVIEQKYKAGGTQRTVQELLDAGDRVGGEQLS